MNSSSISRVRVRFRAIAVAALAGVLFFVGSSACSVYRPDQVAARFSSPFTSDLPASWHLWRCGKMSLIQACTYPVSFHGQLQPSSSNDFIGPATFPVLLRASVAASGDPLLYLQIHRLY